MKAELQVCDGGDEGRRGDGGRKKRCPRKVALIPCGELGKNFCIFFIESMELFI